MAGEQEFKEKLRAMGSEIRAQRESLGLSIDEASAKTKLRAKYLIAVEAGQDTEAPGNTYFKAFLKTYSTFLGLDGSSYSAAYQKALEERDAPQPRQKPRPVEKAPEKPARVETGLQPDKLSVEPRPAPAIGDTPVPTVPVSRSAIPVKKELPLRRPPRRRRRTNPALWLFLLVFIVAAGIYVWAQVREAPEAPPAAVTPDHEPQPPVVTPNPEPDPPPAPKVVRTEISPTEVAFTVDRTPLELTLKTGQGEDSYCWVRAIVDGEMAFEKTLPPGHEEKISAESKIAIRAGKPWILSLVINGQDQGLAGVFGPVKDISVTKAP